MQKLLCILFLVLFLGQVKSQGQNTWQKANNFYKQKQFDSAIRLYETIAQKENNNAIVFYNLGNAYYKNNKIGLSILNYEKSIFYNPYNEATKENLLLAKSRISNSIKPIPDIFFVRWWHAITLGQMSNIWAGCALLIFIIWIGIFALNIAFKQSIRFSNQLNFLLPITLVFVLVFAYQSANNKSQSHKAVVCSPTAMMQTSPNNLKSSISIPEGTTVSINNVSGNWIEVNLPNKQNGWMQISDLEFVTPKPK